MLWEDETMQRPQSFGESVESVDFATFLPQEEAAIYQRVLEAVVHRKMSFALGGGLAFSIHSGRWRYTKDIDLYVEPQDAPRFVALLDEHGFKDYHERRPYDRQWIYRGYRDQVIADVIFRMANKRAEVDRSWLDRASHVRFCGLPVKVLAPEELIWAKLFVVQRDRCDWPDLLNIINVQGPTLDWDHLLMRAGPDRLLLSAVMCVYRWLCPEGSQRISGEVWRRLNLDSLPLMLQPPGSGMQPAALLDGRDWFGPSEGTDHCLKSA
jgi:hypothetical protein